MRKWIKTAMMLEALTHSDGAEANMLNLYTITFIQKSDYPSDYNWFILRLFQEITDFVENGFLAGALYAGNIVKDCQNLQNIKIRTINKDNIKSIYNFNDNESWILIFSLF